MSDNHDLHDERISKLYRTGSRDEPPKHLDEKIIQAARSTSLARKQRLSWPSLATAAVLVLSISLVLKVLNQAPLEKTITEPPPTDDSSTLAPAVELRRNAGAGAPAPAPAPTMQDRDSNGQGKSRQSPEKYRAKLQSAAPATTAQEGDGEDGALLESLPTEADQLKAESIRLLKRKAAPNTLTGTSELTDGMTQADKPGLDCHTVPLPESASTDVWQQQYQTALKQGQSKTAECLKQGYYRKFGQYMPKLEQSDTRTTH